jgi:PX domain
MTIRKRWVHGIRRRKKLRWLIGPRYSEFDKLRRNLSRTFPSSEAAMPELPPKSVICKHIHHQALPTPYSVLQRLIGFFQRDSSQSLSRSGEKAWLTFSSTVSFHDSSSFTPYGVLVLTCFDQLCPTQPGVLCISRPQGIYILLTIGMGAENPARRFMYNLMDTRVHA